LQTVSKKDDSDKKDNTNLEEVPPANKTLDW
jgi:hypothetical protein